MELDTIVYLWCAVAGAAGGIGRFCRSTKKWKVATIVSFAVIGAISATIAVGLYFGEGLSEHRLKVWSIAMAVGFAQVDAAVVMQIVAKTLNLKIGGEPLKLEDK